jgi:hypothetical protein
MRSRPGSEFCGTRAPADGIRTRHVVRTAAAVLAPTGGRSGHASVVCPGEARSGCDCAAEPALAKFEA